MRSTNPVFTKADGFNGDVYAGNGQTYEGFGTSPTHAGYEQQTRPMTIDSVVNRTGISMVVLIAAAAATWLLTGPLYTMEAANKLYVVTMVGSAGAFVLSLVNSFKKAISPALVLAYAALQGVAVGGISKVFDAQFGGGIITGAVLGTFAAFAGTLAAYKFFNIKVTAKFRTWVIGAMFGFVALTLLDFVLGFFGASFGWNGLAGIGLISAVIGVGIAVLMLILDFDFVERGVAARLPEVESWRAAFGLTVTIVWIYVQLLRILAILRGD